MAHPVRVDLAVPQAAVLAALLAHRADQACLAAVPICLPARLAPGACPQDLVAHCQAVALADLARWADPVAGLAQVDLAVGAAKQRRPLQRAWGGDPKAMR